MVFFLKAIWPSRLALSKDHVAQSRPFIMSAIASQIREFIADNFLLGQDAESLEGDASFTDSGVIDSTGVLELVGFLEDTFGIQISDDEMSVENLDSLNRVSAFVEQKVAALGESA